MRDVLFIPGIGGHPIFHKRLIAGLQDRFHIHTAPHGDFYCAPYETLDTHVDYWIRKASDTGAGDLGLVAVSFGTHVVPELVRRCAGDFSRVVLISPWIQCWPDRALIRTLRMLPARRCASLLARSLMGWSERRVEHVDEIRRYRRELYDEQESVAARWHNRMLVMGDAQGLTWRALHCLSRQRRLTVLFGREEWLWKLQGRRMARMASRSSRFNVCFPKGGHEIGTFSTSEVVSMVTAALD